MMEERAKKNHEENYEMIKVIDYGAFGIVYKGKEREKDELRAIKVIDLQKITDNLINQYGDENLKEHLELCINGFKTEFENMKLCSESCENSVKCYEYFNNEDIFVIIMELCDTNLSKFLTQRKKKYGKGFNSGEILKIMKQLNNAFKVMKENNIIHRDLKLENILIKYIDKENERYIVKLSDYGCSKRLSSLSKNYLNSINGTLPYMAPEILKGEEYNYKCDLWSIGIIIYKLYFGVFPYNGNNEIAISENIEQLGKKRLIKTDNKDLDDLIINLLEIDSLKRLTWAQYLNHSFFQDTNKIRLIYECEEDKKYNIFGKKFVENNKNNIELIINGNKSELIEKYKLNKGKNDIEIIIKNKIINMEYMFHNCNTLINIDKLKYLDVKEINDFSYMFSGCSSLLNLEPIQNWNVSNGNNFSYMFSKCSSLSDLKPLQNWNVSKGNNFKGMFSGCKLLSDLKPIQNWKASNDDLYIEFIELYTKQKNFSFLFALFLKLYQKKDLCQILLENFRKITEYEYNMDIEPFLKEYTSQFNSIISEADNLIDNNHYHPIEFYGILLCYLNCFIYDKFCSIVNELYNKKKKILFEILIIYNVHFRNPINQNEFFFHRFINYTIKSKEDFKSVKRGLSLIKDIETFVAVIEKNKEEFYDKCKLKKNIYIKLDNLKFKKSDEKIDDENYNIYPKEKENNKHIFEFLNNIRSIIKFSKEYEIFFIYFTNNFWQYMLNYFNEPKPDNIIICYKLRSIFIEYYNLVTKVIVSKNIIRKESNAFFEKDEFAFLLNQMIKKFIHNNNLDNIEKLAFLVEYNPYYRESKYSHQIDCNDIIDLIDLSKIDYQFIEDFKNMRFEIIFKYNIVEYISKMVGKINKITDFETIIILINVKYIEDKNILLEQLKAKYDNIITNEIDSLTNENLEEAINNIAKIVIINYICQKENKLEFINSKRIKKFSKKTINLIYCKIINIILDSYDSKDKYDSYDYSYDSKDENADFDDLKTFIFEELSKNVSDGIDIENIIRIIDCLEGQKQTGKNKLFYGEEKYRENGINEFFEKLIENNLFTENDFFSCKQNYRILLIYELYEKGKFKSCFGEEYYEKIIDLLFKIHEYIHEIEKSKLEEFLRIEQSQAIQRLKLFKLILSGYDPEEEYEQMKNINNKINQQITKFEYIKDNIIIYHKEIFKVTIKELIDVTNNQDKRKISYYLGERIWELNLKIEKLKDLADIVNKVKNFLLFNIIYEMSIYKDEYHKFDMAYKELEKIGNLLEDENIIELNNQYQNIFKIIKEKLGNNEDMIKEFIKNLIDYYHIDNEKLIDELTNKINCY